MRFGLDIGSSRFSYEVLEGIYKGDSGAGGLTHDWQWPGYVFTAQEEADSISAAAMP